ncbi:MAG: hypothetical protein ACP5N7_05935 [Candidatus Pacearchaeota archaeon]
MLAQNEDQSSALQTTQAINNKVFESTLEALRVIGVTEFTISTAVIDSNVAVGDSIDLADDRLIAIIIPSTWTTANLTFLASLGNGVWYNIYTYDGTELTYTAAASRWLIVKPIDFAGIRYLKIRSGTSGTPVLQADDRDVSLVKRGY